MSNPKSLVMVGLPIHCTSGFLSPIGGHILSRKENYYSDLTVKFDVVFS